jgi:SAM-dependent methyltransferase
MTSATDRPKTWEDDISRNSLDIAPFENGKPISSYSVSEFPPLELHLPVDLLESPIEAYVARDPFPIPSLADREGYHPNQDIPYWLSGLRDYLKMMSITRPYVTPQSVYEFGAASGRVLRHVCAQSQIDDIWASDLNRRHVRWLCDHLPQKVKAFHHPSLPSLPIADSSLDLIYAFSVFTHIDTFETAWLAELRRILRPGGIAYVTVHDEDTWRALREAPADNRILTCMRKTANFIEDQLASEMPGEWLVYRHTQTGPYRGLVFHSQDYIARIWGRFFKIVQTVPRAHYLQTVVVLGR